MGRKKGNKNSGIPRTTKDTRGARMNTCLDRFQRYAERRGKTVEWGNIIGPYIGQQFRETFATEEEAEERKRQALALEPIGSNRPPIAVSREKLR